MQASVVSTAGRAKWLECRIPGPGKGPGFLMGPVFTQALGPDSQGNEDPQLLLGGRTAWW